MRGVDLVDVRPVKGAALARQRAKSVPLPGPPQLKVHSWYVLNRAAQRLRELVEAALLPLGLRRRHYAALCVIAEEGPLTQQELSLRIPIDRVAMVSVMDDLEAAGLAERRKDPSDRRVWRLVLTPKGHRVREQAAAAIETAEAEGFAALSGAELTRLDRLARRLCGWDGAAP